MGLVDGIGLNPMTTRDRINNRIGMILEDYDRGRVLAGVPVKCYVLALYE